MALSLRAGEVLGIAGVSGHGQRELLAALSGEDPVSGHKPSIDVMFRSAAAEAGAQAGGLATRVAAKAARVRRVAAERGLDPAALAAGNALAASLRLAAEAWAPPPPEERLRDAAAPACR